MSQRYEREIEEILRRLDPERGTTPRPIRPPPQPAGVNQTAGHWLWTIYNLRWRTDAEQLVLIAFAAALIGLAATALIPLLALPIAIAVMVLFVVGYFGSYRKRTAQPERLWRGKPIDYRRNGFAVWWDAIRQRWRRRS